MKKLNYYGVETANSPKEGVDLLLKMFDELAEVASTVDYTKNEDRETYKQYVKSMRRYFDRCEKLIVSME